MRGPDRAWKQSRNLPSLAAPDLFRPIDPSLAVLKLPDDGSRRAHALTHGLAAVLAELSVQPAAEVGPGDVDRFDRVLVSLTSPRDAVALCRAFPEAPKRARLIVGGQGVYGFLGWRHLVSRIVFGRAEGAADALVMAGAPSLYAYDYAEDPGVTAGPYYIRRPRHLVPGEVSIGCPGACTFCQYRAVRPVHGRADGGRYSLPSLGSAPSEDRWADLPATSGRIMTALDGWSEDTRRRVKKPVTDAEVVEKLARLGEASARLRSAAILKVFQIVGYPWETLETLRADLERFRALLSRVPVTTGGRVVIMFQNTPFLPEPLTDLERAPCNIDADWLGLLRGPDFKVVYDGPMINAFNRPQIYGPRMRLERVAINRGVHADIIRRMVAARDLDTARGLVDGIWKEGAGDYVSGVLKVEPRRPAGSGSPRQ